MNLNQKMDAISIAIIVTVLSMGSFLVYLFKTEFERTQKYGTLPAKSKRASNNNATNKKSAPQNQAQASKPSTHQATIGNNVVSANGGLASAAATKQVASEPSSQPSSNAFSNSNNNNHLNSAANGKLSSRSNGHILIDSNKLHNNGDNNNNNQQQQQHKASAKPATSLAATKKVVSNKKTDFINGGELAPAKLHVFEVSFQTEPPRGSEPSADELDSSVLLGVFNPLQNHHHHHAASKQSKLTSSSNNNKIKSRQQQQQQTTDKKLATKKRRNSGEVNYASGSSEQLLSMISKCDLSKDEIEFAVESLLNKIESGESNWQQPKSNPLQRLKNQLRDSESALSIEAQNHEQTKVRLLEIKGQLQSERSNSNFAKEELSKIKKEFGLVNLTLEQVRCDLSKQHILHKQLKEESSHVISKLEQEKAQLQAVLSSASGKETELIKLRKELDEKMNQLQRYELSNQTMREKIEELEVQLNGAKLLENSVNELKLINGRQEDMLQRLADERHLNEASMKRTLCEMEQELKELQTKLSANSASHDERHRKELSQVERELNNADQREQKLMSEIRELREGLAALLPKDLKANESFNRQQQQQGDTNWVQQYLAAFKQLAKTVDELRELNNNNNNNNNGLSESPSKKSVDKSTLTVSTRANGTSSRVGSPSGNGRSSRSE